MGVAVHHNFVPLVDDPADEVWVALDVLADDAERRADVVAAEQVEDRGQAHACAVMADGERAGAPGVLRIEANPDRFGIEVEAEAGGG